MIRATIDTITYTCGFIASCLALIGSLINTIWSVIKTVWIIGLVAQISAWFGAFIVAFFLISTGTPVRAMTVSDPTSYTYYVEEIEKSVEQIEKMSENITEVQNVVAQTKEVVGQLKGYTGMAKGWLKDFQEVAKDFKDQPLSILDYISKYLPKDKSLKDYEDERGSIDVEKVLNEAFIDPRTPGFDPLEEENKRRAMIQEALKNTIVEAGDSLNKMPERLQTIEDLGALLDSSKKNESLKASQDLTATILLEILTTLREMQNTINRFAHASSLTLYTGHDPDLSEKAILSEPAQSKSTQYLDMENDNTKFNSFWNSL